MMKSGKACELCNGEVAAYCSADTAFLCLTCDVKVHQANSLAARHVRQIVCSNCKGFTGGRISGVGFLSACDICPSCSPEYSHLSDLDSLSSSSSSACMSSTESSCASSRKKSCSGRLSSTSAMTMKSHKGTWRVNTEAEGIYVNWCKRLGLQGDAAAVVVQLACEAFGVCLNKWTLLPFRVSLVVSLWLGFRFCGLKSLSTWQALKKLEEISGVPAKVISAAEWKLERLFKTTRTQRRHQLLQESWAES